MKPIAHTAFRSLLLATCSAGIAVPAMAQVGPTDVSAVRPASGDPVSYRIDGAIDEPAIIGRDDLPISAPIPRGTLDNAVDITGVGQIVTSSNPFSGGIGLCTGTLINPRTVLFAAHCVNDAPASSYGAATGGTAISVGFKADNYAPLLDWLFGPETGGPAFQTSTANALYNIEQVWYDPRSVAPSSCTAPGSCFLEADLAMGTLDTHADGIPTWALLFSPLDGQTHVTVNGYGNVGYGSVGALGVDYRRHAAENMLSVLGSLDDRNDWLFGPSASPENPQNLYQLDFDSPGHANQYDFDIFPGDALPREGSTAPGDSGGPLIIDERFPGQKVVAGVLSGGTRFFNGQPASSYGGTSFYQPLYLFWETIVANNPYAYVTTKAGNGEWTDPRHWVQTMDPAYQIIASNGSLLNALPGFKELGVSGAGPKFGQVCDGATCIDLVNDSESTPLIAGTPNSIYVPGGPGTTNFVPNNVVADPRIGRKARYYDVTLSQGLTRLTGADITIDRLTVGGSAELWVRPGASLTSLADYTQTGGAVQVDGRLKTGEALIARGLLSGVGTVDPTFLTVVQGVIAPGTRNGVGIGTLTIQGDLILSSGSFFEVGVSRAQTDKIVVLGDAQNKGIASLGGTVLFTNASGAVPRDGQSFEILSAAGGVQGTFNGTAGRIGVLQPVLSYTANSVIAQMKAGKLSQNLAGESATALSFANALDGLRAGNYNKLYNLYGAVDVMDAASLTASLETLSPARMARESVSLADRQSDALLGTVANRLSSLGASGTAGTLSVVGEAGSAMSLASGQQDIASLAALNGSAGVGGQQRAASALPYGMSGFVSGGTTAAGSSMGVRGEQRTRSFGMGLELPVGENATFGTAFGYSDGYGDQTAAGTRSESRVSQAAVYGSYRLGGGAYLAGMGALETGRMDVNRASFDGDRLFALTGATESTRATAVAEAGVNMNVARGLQLTPRAGLEYSSLRLGGFEEQGGETALRMDGLKLDRFEARAGLKLAGASKLRGGWTLSPQISADYRQALTDPSAGMSVRFAAAEGESFMLPFGMGDRSWGEVAGGLRFQNGPLAFGAGIESSVGRSNWNDNRAVADVTFRF